jgi:HlyD family secretion protein
MNTVYLRPIAIIMFLVFLLQCQKKEKTSIDLAETYKVKKESLRDIITQTGVISPVVKLELKSEASGKIEKIFVKEGQEVSKGDTILIIDPYRLTTQKEKLELSIRKSELLYKAAERDLNNAMELVVTGSIASKKIQDLEIARDLQEIDLKQQKLELADIIDQLGKTIIRSPIHGVLTSLLVKEGEIAVSATGGLSAGTSIGTIADIRKLEVITNVGEIDYVHLSKGQNVVIKPEAIEGSETKGTIDFIALSAKKDGTSDLSRFEVRVLVDSIIKGIAPGINVSVDFVVLDKKNVIAVPYHFVKRIGKESFVAKKIGEKHEQIKIVTGITDYKFYEVISGINEGEEIVYIPDGIAQVSRGKK